MKQKMHDLFIEYWKLYFYVAIGLIPVWKLFKLHPFSLLAIALSILVLLPVYKMRFQEMKWQRQRLKDVSLYMDAMLYAFQKEGKILNALQDVHASLGEGDMRFLVEQVMNYVEMAYDDEDVNRRGLTMIYDEYPARRIRNLHEFMLHVECYGGEVKAPIELMLLEKEMWELRMKKVLAERSKMFRDVVLSIITSLLICAVVLYLPVLSMDFSKNVISQVMTVMVFSLDEIILLRAQKYLAVDWIALEADEEDDFYREQMRKWRNWNEKKERRLSMVLGSIALAFTIFAFVIGKFWYGCLGILLTMLCLKQHKIGHKLNEKTVWKEVLCAFPVWLMDMVLLLQTENVQNALRKSLEHAPGVLYEELELLLDKLDLEPESAKPYHEFLADFDVPEIHSAFNLLYAMSMGQGGSVEQQVSNLIRRNQEMQDIAERQQDEDRSSGLYLLFLAPVLTGSIKLLVDMGLFMISFLASSM